MTNTRGTDTQAPPVVGYTFDNATPEAGRQVRLLADILDGHTTQVLAREGVEDGRYCLDLGAGAGTVSTWLAKHVGPTGRVVAVDLDPRHIPHHDLVEVRIGDVTTMYLGTDLYDVIHARLLLMHLPDRVRVLQRIVAALKPGGVLVVSEWDCTHPEDMLVRAADGVADAFVAFQKTLIGLSVERGMDAAWARVLPVAMRDAGLQDVTEEPYNRVWAGGQSGCLLHASNSRQKEPELLARGITADQLDTVRTAMQRPDTLAWSYPMVTAVGHRADH